MSTLSLTQTAERMHVHENTVARLISHGEIPAAKIGRSWVLLERDVDAYIQAQVDKQTAKRLGIPEPRRRHQSFTKSS